MFLHHGHLHRHHQGHHHSPHLLRSRGRRHLQGPAEKTLNETLNSCILAYVFSGGLNKGGPVLLVPGGDHPAAVLRGHLHPDHQGDAGVEVVLPIRLPLLGLCLPFNMARHSNYQ